MLPPAGWGKMGWGKTGDIAQNGLQGWAKWQGGAKSLYIFLFAHFLIKRREKREREGYRRKKEYKGDFAIFAPPRSFAPLSEQEFFS